MHRAQKTIDSTPYAVYYEYRAHEQTVLEKYFDQMFFKLFEEAIIWMAKYAKTT